MAPHSERHPELVSGSHKIRSANCEKRELQVKKGILKQVQDDASMMIVDNCSIFQLKHDISNPLLMPLIHEILPSFSSYLSVNLHIDYYIVFEPGQL